MRVSKISFITMFLVILSVPAFAQSTASVKYNQLYVLGKGLAVNPSNNMDIDIVSIGVAQVLVNVKGSITNVTIGVMNFQNKTYVLKGLSITDSAISGNIYLNDSSVGSFSLGLITKPTDDIWTGIMVLSQTYNVYILEAHRAYTPSESSATIASYCKNANDTNCTGSIEDFCKSNPNDSKCVSLENNYCKDNLQDSRCRQELSSYCQKNASAIPCVSLCQKYPGECGLKVAPNITRAERPANATYPINATRPAPNTTRPYNVTRPNVTCQSASDCAGKIACPTVCRSTGCYSPVCQEGYCYCRFVANATVNQTENTAAVQQNRQ